MPELMKGEVWADHKHKVTYPVRVEEKIDEIRMHVKLVNGAVEFLSYAGKPLNNLERYAEAFATWFKLKGYTELDGGVLVGGDFNKTYRYVRSKSIPADLTDAPVRFMLYDLPEEADTPYDLRRFVVARIAEELREIGLPAYVPVGHRADNEDAVMEVYQLMRAAGREGAMVKTLDHKYMRKRNRAWLKLKPSETADGKIVALNEARSEDGRRLGRVGSFTVALEDGSIASPAGIAHALGFAMWANPTKYVGQWIEFGYMERDRAGGYRHPFFIRLREEK